jgi:hypothetical protein
VPTNEQYPHTKIAYKFLLDYPFSENCSSLHLKETKRQNINIKGHETKSSAETSSRTKGADN